MDKYDVIIVGAGIAGLSAAIRLQQEGLKIKLVEASDGVGGRMKTDKVEGYLLDRGFQVLLTAYPEAQKLLDYDTLALRNFLPGSKIHYQGKLYEFIDPFRKPIKSIRSLNNAFSNIGDKLKIVGLRNRVRRLDVEALFEQEEKPTIDYLREWHFSKAMINSFFKPFLSGIFLEPDLLTSSRMFEFVFKMFGKGYAALPKDGMQAIPNQLANKLKEDTLLLNTPVHQVTERGIVLENGEEMNANIVLVAVDAPNVKKILPEFEDKTTMNGVRCLYFAADEPPFQEPLLVLNGNNSGWINNVAIPTNVQKSYAPEGKSLISVSVVKPSQMTDTELYIAVRKELGEWFGKDMVSHWIHLKTYNIQHALPARASVTYPKAKDIQPFKKGIFVCGDYQHDSSINGAIRSGRINADAVSWHLALAVNQ